MKGMKKMSEHRGYITALKNVRAHPNADRMKLADCFGNTVCVGLNAQEGDVVIYFPTDGQLSKAYAELNNLVRIKNEDGTYSGGYLDPDKRNIKAIKLRGEKSDGLTMPLSSLDAFGDTSALKVGDTISVFNGHEICKKYQFIFSVSDAYVFNRPIYRCLFISFLLSGTR